MGFSKPVEIFDRHGLTFVSVTQSFNTTPSMGRLTLNILLSFARFEREVIGERIRDKVAVSKKKGMWMDGYVPLGYDYDAVDRKLIVNEAEAANVWTMFELFARSDSTAAVIREPDPRDIRSKRGRPCRAGEPDDARTRACRLRPAPETGRVHIPTRTLQTRPSPPHSAAEACRGRHGPRTQPASAARHRTGLGMAAADGARRGRRHRRSRRKARHLRPPSCAALKGQHPGPEPLRSTTVGCTRIHSRQNAGSKIKR